MTNHTLRVALAMAFGLLGGAAPLAAAELSVGPLTPPSRPTPIEPPIVVPLPTPRPAPPTPVIDGTQLRSQGSSPYAVELLVSDRARLPHRQGDGSAVIPIDRGETYTIRLSNDSDTPAAAALTIDGRSIFTYSRVGEFGHFLVPARSAIVIRGWFRDRETSEAFVVEPAPEFEAYRDNRWPSPPWGDVGRMVVTFAPTWPESRLGEAAASGPASRLWAPDHTGRGPLLDTPYDIVHRRVGPVAAVLRFRYTSQPLFTRWR